MTKKKDNVVILEGKVLPPRMENITINLGDEVYILSLESIKCRISSIRDTSNSKTAAEILREMSEVLGEQIQEMSDYVEKEQVKKRLVDAIFDFLWRYWIQFSDAMIQRAGFLLEGVMALIYKFFLSLGNLVGAT